MSAYICVPLTHKWVEILLDTPANKEAKGRDWHRVAKLGFMWICKGSLKIWLAAPSSPPTQTEACA